MLSVLKDKQRKVSLYSNILMVLTSVHHVYGAIIYHTPWRMHVLLLSIPVIVVTVLLNYFPGKKGSNFNVYLFSIYWGLILLFSILPIGVFEGIYNHILKNVLFFGGFPKDLMSRLFPSGMYEMPDNFFFELTGVLQGLVAIPLILYFIQLSRLALSRRMRSRKKV